MPLPLIIAGIAAGVSFLGSVLQGAGAKQQADAQAAADEENAALLRQRALDVLGQGQRQAGQVRSAASKAIAAQNVAFTAGGVDASSGTPAALAMDSRIMAELDALTIKSNAGKEARSLYTQAGQLQRHAAAARTAGDFALAGSLLGGLAGSAGMAYNAGLFGKVA